VGKYFSFIFPVIALHSPTLNFEMIMESVTINFEMGKIVLGLKTASVL